MGNPATRRGTMGVAHDQAGSLWGCSQKGRKNKSSNTRPSFNGVIMRPSKRSKQARRNCLRRVSASRQHRECPTRSRDAQNQRSRSYRPRERSAGRSDCSAGVRSICPIQCRSTNTRRVEHERQNGEVAASAQENTEPTAKRDWEDLIL
jgi:hypothetical protein